MGDGMQGTVGLVKSLRMNERERFRPKIMFNLRSYSLKTREVNAARA